MKKSLLAAAVLVTVTIGACGRSGEPTAAMDALRAGADRAAIGELEVKWHKASSTKDLDLMMSIWADNGVLTVGGATLTGKEQIRNFFATKAAPFQPSNHWISETPAYKIKITVDGDKGTIYFECHYVDVKTKQLKSVIGANTKVARIGGEWKVTSSVAGPATLK